METTSRIHAPSSSRSVANTVAAGKSMPAVPVLQQKQADEEEKPQAMDTLASTLLTSFAPPDNNTTRNSSTRMPAVSVLQQKTKEQEESPSQTKTGPALLTKFVAPVAQMSLDSTPKMAFSPVVQREIIVNDEFDNAAFTAALKTFLAALRQQKGQVANYLKFVEDPGNNHNLVFKTIQPKRKTRGELHGTTNVTFSGTSKDILDHMFMQELDPNEKIEDIMEGIDHIKVMKGIDIVIEVAVSSSYGVPILLETLNHEFTVHAIKWFDFIHSVYNKGDVEKELRQRIIDMPRDHKEFGRDQNDTYKGVRQTIYNALKEQEVPDFSSLSLGSTLSEQFMQLSREAIVSHKPYEDVRLEIEQLITTASALDNTPLLHGGFKNKPKPKQEPADNCCCYITTACIRSRGLPDDCEELTVLRAFRDSYLMNKTNGDALIALYYQHSPQIMANIQRRDDEEEILRRLYGIIRQCVDAIKMNNPEFAYRTYCEMVIRLKEEFAPELEVRVPAI